MMLHTLFHSAVANWFSDQFTTATPAQTQAWPAIKQGQHTLIAAPTGSGKTLAAFLAAIDELIVEGLEIGLKDQVYVLYVSPLKALSNDIQKNLQDPLQNISKYLNALQLPDVEIRAQVRTGDTPQNERDKMRKKPPHILVTTPESLFILLTSASGRAMLGTVRNVIIDEIHALASNKRGAHLALSLERLHALTLATQNKPPVRIGLSATQKPIDRVAQFLVGARNEHCVIVDSGHKRKRDIAIEVTGSPLSAVMANEIWQEVYDRLFELINEHKTTLIFVNNRRLAERAARFLAERLGENQVTAHHGSLAREHRLDAEQRLKQGQLKAMVATASLELGIDIGDVDLVCQIGSPHSIAAFLQRVGRANHAVDGLPKGRLFPISRDDLVECAALLHAAQNGELDSLEIPNGPQDVLAQQLIAELACAQWQEQSLYQTVRQALPYANLSETEFDTLLNMLAEGFSTRRGRRSAYIHRDAVNHQLRGRKNAKLTAVTNAGVIPDQFDYDVIMEPQGQFIGSLNEDFAFESLPGDIFQLGNISYRILKIESSIVRVEDAQGQPPNIPFWFGEAPGRTDELSQAVSQLRQNIDEKLTNEGLDNTIEWLVTALHIPGQAAVQLAEYLAAARNALGGMPTQQDIYFERFFDEAGDQHIVIHSPYGSRLNRAWGLALRKKFCRKFNFELQAAALEDSIVISLGATHSFPLEEVQHYVKAAVVKEVVTQAMLAIPLFLTRWRWNASTALAIKRNRNGKRVPAQFQRMDAEDLISVIFPDQLACQDNIVGEREIPEHPLVQQTIHDCLTDAMDIDGLAKLLKQTENGLVNIHCRDLAGASPLAQEILTARPYAFLDDAPAEERRTRAVAARRFMSPEEAGELGRLDQDAIKLVQEQAWPSVSNADELHDALLRLGFIEAESAAQQQHALLNWQDYFAQLQQQQRACLLTTDKLNLWCCAERLVLLQALFPDAQLTPAIQAAGPASQQDWSHDAALVELLRSRLECLGPVSENTLAQSLQQNVNNIQIALYQLESQGYAMRGQFTDAANAEQQQQWCERGLLARIHRYTLKRLREAVKPVNIAEFMRFLFQWHGLNQAEQASGSEALALRLQQLEGFSLPASTWETDILPPRLAAYTTLDLDQLCSHGRFIWARLPQKSKAQSGPIKTTAITLLERTNSRHWLYCATTVDTQTLSSTAQSLLTALQQYGACFFVDLVQHTGMLRTQVENALGELAANGLVHSDSFIGLRALITPQQKRPGFARRSRRRSVQSQPLNHIDNAGRWAIITAANSNEQDKQTVSQWLSTPYEVLEHIAWVLLHRYGVVFRKILEREQQLPAWRELLYAYRRLEARGDIRGGRFVDGVGGEQFALPDAAAQLRKMREQQADDHLVVINASDPLNLTGILLPGLRVPAIANNRLLFKNGLLVAHQQGNKVEFVGAFADNLNADSRWQAQNLLTQRYNPAAYQNGNRRPI